MSGQDQQSLGEREGEAGDHHYAERVGDLAHRGGQREARRDEEHGGEHGDHDRHRDLERARDRSVDRISPPRLMPRRVLSHDDGVVDDQAERDDEGEHRHHVDRHTQKRERHERPEECDRDAHRHPEGEPQAQEECQDGEDEEQPRRPVAQQQLATALELERLVTPDVEGDAGREIDPRLIEPGVYGPGDVGHVAGLAGEQPHEDGGLAVESHVLVTLDEPVSNPGDVAELDPRTVRVGEEDEPLELITPVGAPSGPHQDLAAAGLERSTGEIHRRGAHRTRHVVEGQTVPSQRRLGDLDRDLVVARSHELGPRHLGEGRHLVAEPLTESVERVFVGLAVDRDGDQHVIIDELLDDRDLRALGQGVERIDAGAHLLEDTARILPHLNLHPDRPEALGRA
jgi:hypothetical protein